MSGKGNCHHNSAVESFFKVKAKLVWRRNWQTRREAEVALFDDISGFYNPRRKHSALGWKSPVAAKHEHLTGTGTGSSQPCPPVAPPLHGYQIRISFPFPCRALFTPKSPRNPKRSIPSPHDENHLNRRATPNPATANFLFSPILHAFDPFR